MKKLKKLEKNTKFLEIERKYNGNTVDWNKFVKKCKKLSPCKELKVSGPNTYYENGDSIVRWRYSKDLSELTTKSRFTKRSSLLREEVDLKITPNNPKTVIRFLDVLGYKKIFKINKDCHIFWFEDKNGEVSVVIYKVTSKEHSDKIFIEIEAKKGQSIKDSKKMVRAWEKRLGLKKHWRINKTLLEIYSDRETQLVETEN